MGLIKAGSLQKHDTVTINGITGVVTRRPYDNKILESRMGLDGELLSEGARRPAVGSVTFQADDVEVKATVALDESVEANRWPCGYCNGPKTETDEMVMLSPQVTAKVVLCEHGTRYLTWRRNDQNASSNL